MISRTTTHPWSTRPFRAAITTYPRLTRPFRAENPVS